MAYKTEMVENSKVERIASIHRLMGDPVNIRILDYLGNYTKEEKRLIDEEMVDFLEPKKHVNNIAKRMNISVKKAREICDGFEKYGYAKKFGKDEYGRTIEGGEILTMDL